MRSNQQSQVELVPSRGWSQARCNLSPYLFNIFSELLVRTALEGFDGGLPIGGIRLTNLRYADDIVLIASSREELQNLISRLNLACDEFGMKIYCGQTYVMRLNSIDGQQKEFAGKYALQECQKFSCLGSLFDSDSNSNVEFESRLKKAYDRLFPTNIRLAKEQVITKTETSSDSDSRLPHSHLRLRSMESQPRLIGKTSEL